MGVIGGVVPVVGGGVVRGVVRNAFLILNLVAVTYITIVSICLVVSNLPTVQRVKLKGFLFNAS